jgi:hypothetical protein
MNQLLGLGIAVAEEIEKRVRRNLQLYALCDGAIR